MEKHATTYILFPTLTCKGPQVNSPTESNAVFLDDGTDLRDCAVPPGSANANRPCKFNAEAQLIGG
jgi:hypothetical protein